jgi:uncharacterized surface protein with fasciclin (FAS1) repeats
MSNITETVSKELNMSTLNRGILASGISEFLNAGDLYTFFAPSDMAFGKLSEGTIKDLLEPESKARLIQLLRNHIVAGKLNFKDLQNGDKLKTLDGNELVITENWGQTSVNSSVIQNSDIQASNGTIHSLDKVLLN